MRHGDAFAGIGGFGLAAKRAGWRTVWAAEIDEAARAIYEHRCGSPDLRFDRDIRESVDVPALDVLTGGFPCQDLSIAGRGAGFSGYRSSLFHDLARILHETRPRWFVFENVPGLLFNRHAEDFATVIEGITGFRPVVPVDGWRSAGVAYGPRYGLAWRVLDARFFGVAQRRRRVFIVGHSTDWRRAASVLFEPESSPRDLAARASARRADYGTGIVSTLESSSRGKGYDRGSAAALSHVVSSLLARGAKGIGTTVDGQIVAHALTASQAKSCDTAGSGGMGPVNLVVSPALVTRPYGDAVAATPPLVASPDAARMGTPDGVPGPLDVCPHCGRGPDGPRYRGCGNAVSPPVVDWIATGINAVDVVTKIMPE